MKLKLKFAATLVAGFLLAGMNLSAQTPVTNSYFQNVSSIVLDDNPNGVLSTINVSGLLGTVSDVSVSLNITGGYNGDLYAYLVDPTGNFAVLLNRVGVGGSDWFGYGDTGFDVMYTTTATDNIHFYQNIPGYNLNGSGQLTGTWAADGRHIDPNTQVSPPWVFDTASTTNTINLFLGNSPNGDWTLFVADMSGSFQSTWINWELDMITVPEPASIQFLTAFGGLAAAGAWWRRRRTKAS
jgi:subtilisin-like proprotein convertase family protein